MLADELRTELVEAGASVVGPVGTIADAAEMVGSCQHIDGAVLDVNLIGEMVFPVADILVKRNIPFVFTTGYDEAVIPSRFEDVLRCPKPIDIKRMTRVLGSVLAS